MTNNSNNTVDTAATTTAAANTATPVNSKKVNINRDASKADSAKLNAIAVEHFADLGGASKVVNDLIGNVGDGLHGKTPMTKEELKAMFDRAKAELAAKLDRMHGRAESLRTLPRGTTGAGGFTFSTAITAMWKSMSKSTAMDEVRKGLKAAGLIK